MARPPTLLSTRTSSAPLESVVIASPPPKSRNSNNNIQVCIRIRPLLPCDQISNSTRTTRSSSRRHASGLVTPSSNSHHHVGGGLQEPAWLSPTAQTIIQNPALKQDNSMSGSKQDVAYTFDRVYDGDASNGEVYEESVRDVVRSCVEGFHGSVFAYGQTASGKTHTMTGSTKESGIIRRAVEHIFTLIQSTKDQPSREYLLRVSYLEIYNEQIYDLLAPQGTSMPRFGSSLQHHHLPPSTTVRIFESRTEGVQIRGLKEEIVTCPADVYALLDMGDAKRKVGSTGMNSSSSRSHSVFRLVLESRASSSRGGGPTASSNSSVASDGDSVTSGRSSVGQSLGTAVKGPVRISSLSLVDLAGSESVKATGSTGIRQKEGQYINKSLLTLGHVVHKLSEMSARAEKESSSLMLPPKEHIPYRDSKLTRLLQPSLGGNARVCIICNVSPAAANIEESHNTLKFGSRAKTIQQHASITEIADEKTLLRSYREEIEELKRQLKQLKEDQATVQTPSVRERMEIDSSSDEDQDDTHVLVSAIKNLESLILKTGAKSTVKKTTAEYGSPFVNENAADSNDGLPSRRSLDADLKRVDDIDKDKKTDAAPEEDDHLLEELHRIQGMLGAVMRKRRDKSVATSSAVKKLASNRDEELENLRMQLQKQEITSTMRKADSSFLEKQLAEKETFVQEISDLLGNLENRQNDLERENAELKKELAASKAQIEEGDKMRAALMEKLSKAEYQT